MLLAVGIFVSIGSCRLCSPWHFVAYCLTILWDACALACKRARWLLLSWRVSFAVCSSVWCTGVHSSVCLSRESVSARPRALPTLPRRMAQAAARLRLLRTWGSARRGPIQKGSSEDGSERCGSRSVLVAWVGSRYHLACVRSGLCRCRPRAQRV